MLNDIDIKELWLKALSWGHDAIWSIDFVGQFLLILISFSIAIITRRMIRPHLISRVDQYDIPFRAKQTLKNLTKLILSITALAVIFMGGIIYKSITPDIDLALLTIAMKLLVAWIIIRAILQFIENAFIRNIFALTIWGIAALSIFGVLAQTTATLDSFALTLGDFRLSALAIFKGAFAIFILLYLAIFISSFAERRVFQISSFSRPTQVLMAKIIRITLIVVALLIGITSAGIDLSLFAVFGGAIGLGIGFGLQKGISNMFSGMLLLMDRSIKPGDVIEIPELNTFGWVNNMAARYTEIVTRDNKSVLIPNEDFITQRVINWSHGNSLIRLHLSFGVHYKSDPRKVTEIAIEAAKSAERVVDTPSPVCWVTEFADSSINFDLRFWIKDAEEGVANVRGEVFLALWDAFKANKIEIPYPHREVYMHQTK